MIDREDRESCSTADDGWTSRSIKEAALALNEQSKSFN